MNLQEQKNIYLNRRERMNPELETTLKNGSLDLAKNPAFPKTDSNGNPINFLELIAYKRFNEVVDNSRRYNPNISASNIGELTRTLMEQAYSITDIEQPHLQKLEKLAVKLIVEQMEIPNDVFQYDVKIVPIGSISDENFQQQAQRPSAQDIEKVFGEQAEEENTTPTELFQMEKHKRRFINMLIQGASKKGHYMFVFVKNVLDLLNPQLTEKYGSMMSANDSIYWLFPDETLRRMSSQASSFAGKEEIDDTTDPPTLKVRGINFPVVVHELIKAIMEVFGTQGFPDDPKSAQMIMDSVDSLENEIMDLRLGAVIWELFLSSYPSMVFEEGNRHIQHYLFSRFCALEVNEFFRVARLILSQSQEGSKYMERMANEIVKDLQRQDYNSQFGDDEGYSLDDILGYADGGSVDNQIEIVVVAKELEKDGGNILKFRYLMAFDNEKQAIQHAKKMWIDEYDNSDLHIVEVLTADDYRQKYLQNKYDNGGNVKSSSVNKMMKYDTLVHYVTSNLDKGEKEYLGINAFSKEDAEKKAKIMFNQEDADRYDATIEYVSVWERGEAYKKGGSMYADGGGASNEHYAIKNENGWVLGYKGSSSEMYFSPHTMPITFPSKKIAQEFIDRNATKNPFIQKGIIVKLFSNGGGVDLFSMSKTINDKGQISEMVIAENVSVDEFNKLFSDKGYRKVNDNSLVGFYFAKPNGDTIQLIPSFHKKGEIIKYENGGFAYVDLFEDYENIPANVKAILNDYELEESDYDTLNDLQNELAEVGYTFEFGLDAEPFALRPIGVEVNELQGYEDYEKENFAKGGEANFDIYEWDDKMALINLDEIYEYAIKIDKMIDEDTDLEEWVKMKLTRIEQNIADVKHSLAGWEKYKSGGEISKKQLLHIAKYSKDLIEMIQGGSRLMSWQENKLAISSQSIDDIYHHLDYKMGNRAEDLDVKDKYAGGGGVNRFTDGGAIKKGFMVFNYTDSVYATDEVFKTKKLANDFIKEFRNRFSRQGYYRDNQMNKIAIEDIDLLAIPSDFNPFGKYADGGEMQEEKFRYKDFYQSQGGIKFKTEEEAERFIKTAKPFIRKQLREGNLVLVFNGKEYFIGEKIKINDEYAGGGEIEDWMQSALYQLQAEEDNDNLQISFVKNNEFTCEDDDANEYRVFKNEDVAEQVAIEEVREMMEDEPQSFNTNFLMDFVDVGDFFVTDIEDGNYHYVQDIETESDSKYANRLIAELVQNGLVSEDEALNTDADELSEIYGQDYIQLLTDDQISTDNGVQYFIDNFGEDEFFRIVVDNDLFDFEKASVDAVNMDGIAHFLARYDGETIYLDNNVVAYRTN